MHPTGGWLSVRNNGGNQEGEHSFALLISVSEILWIFEDRVSVERGPSAYFSDNCQCFADFCSETGEIFVLQSFLGDQV